jgi:hypothetical protein
MPKSTLECLLTLQPVANDFLSGPSDRPNFGSATYVVQIVGSGTRKIHLYDRGFQFFDFSDVQSTFPCQPSENRLLTLLL